MADFPNFTQSDLLSEVLRLDPEHYALPVAYEFTGRLEYRQFVKDDIAWYTDLSEGE